MTDFQDASQGYADRYERVRSFAALADNWDSYGASVISPAAIDKAVEVLTHLEALNFPSPYVFPTVVGGVSIEFRWPFCELDITELGEIVIESEADND